MEDFLHVSRLVKDQEDCFFGDRVSINIFIFYFCMLSSSFHVHDAFDEHNLHFVALFFIKHLVVSLNPNSQKDDATKKMLNWPSKF